MNSRTPILLAALAACARPQCDLAAQITTLTGPAAEDCGADAACFDDAFAAGVPAFIRFSSAGIDSVAAHAVVFDGSRVWTLSQGTSLSDPEDIRGNECLDPATVDGTNDARSPLLADSAITCAGYAPENNSYLVCGDGCTPSQCDPQPLPFPVEDP